MNWYPCEMHCHTVHSDGDFTVEELIKTAEERGLSGVCLTDHNTASGREETESYDFPVLTGIEWTTYFGHMLVLGAENYVDWRDALPDTIDEKMREVKKNGGLVGVAHPFQLGTPICTGGRWEYNVRDWSLVDYIEVFSEGCPYLNASNGKAIAMWESLLDKGYKIAPTFGRDWHSAHNDELPTACTFLGCEGALTPEKMKDAVKNGRTIVTVGPLFRFERNGENEFRFHTDLTRSRDCKPYKITVVTNSSKEIFTSPFKENLKAFIKTERNHWYSARLWGKKGELLSVTAPIYVN